MYWYIYQPKRIINPKELTLENFWDVILYNFGGGALRPHVCTTFLVTQRRLFGFFLRWLLLNLPPSSSDVVVGFELFQLFVVVCLVAARLRSGSDWVLFEFHDLKLLPPNMVALYSTLVALPPSSWPRFCFWVFMCFQPVLGVCSLAWFAVYPNLLFGLVTGNCFVHRCFFFFRYRW